MDLDRFKKIAGERICNQLPLTLLENYKIIYPKELSKNGRRIVKVILLIDGKTYSGRASCSIHDVFCKKTGRKIALVRACRNFWKYNYVIEKSEKFD